MDDSIEARFREFHAANPRVYQTLCSLARYAMQKGKRKIGIGALWERMRWDLWLETTDVDFKLNNNFRSRYARLLMWHESDLAGVFEIRTLHTATDVEDPVLESGPRSQLPMRGFDD